MPCAELVIENLGSASAILSQAARLVVGRVGGFVVILMVVIATLVC